jgi:hypothetical protein
LPNLICAGPKVLIYNGNFDIICNHVGVLKMFAAMTNWTGKDLFYRTEQVATGLNLLSLPQP